MPASDAQVQSFVDTRLRPIAERTRALKLAMDDALATMDDVFAALNVAEPTWDDTNSASPPYLLTPGEVLALHAFLTAIRDAIEDSPNYPVVLKSCVKPVSA